MVDGARSLHKQQPTTMEDHIPSENTVIMAFASGFAVGCSLTIILGVIFYTIAGRMIRRCDRAATAAFAKRHVLAGTQSHRPETLCLVCNSMEDLPELDSGPCPLSILHPVSKRSSFPLLDDIGKRSSPTASPLTAMHEITHPKQCQTEKTESHDVAEENERKAREENKLRANGEETAYTSPPHGSALRPVVFNDSPCSCICDVSSSDRNTAFSKQLQPETTETLDKAVKPEQLVTEQNKMDGNREETRYASPPNTVSCRPVVIDNAPICSCKSIAWAGSSSCNSTYLCMKKSPRFVEVSPVAKQMTFSTPAYGNIYRDTIISPQKSVLDDQYEVFPDDHYEAISEDHSSEECLPLPTPPPRLPGFPDLKSTAM